MGLFVQLFQVTCSFKEGLSIDNFNIWSENQSNAMLELKVKTMENCKNKYLKKFTFSPF
jgi:hypothetical protein